MQNRTNRRTAAEVERHVPLRPVAFAVLAALADGPRPGIDILDEVNTTVPRRPLLGPGTLYRLMRELRQEGLIARTDRAAGVHDERQAYHVLTSLGLAVLRAEVARLRRTIELAAGVAPASEP
jgi:DNA-binding PadR family transcriptional regulator